eukprot:1050234-Rhodomonas_salina.1
MYQEFSSRGGPRNPGSGIDRNTRVPVPGYPGAWVPGTQPGAHGWTSERILFWQFKPKRFAPDSVSINSRAVMKYPGTGYPH